jgi:hypothetical protein
MKPRAWLLICGVLAGCASPPPPERAPSAPRESTSKVPPEQPGDEDTAPPSADETGAGGYLPASEHGAEVEMSELPDSSNPPPPAQRTAPMEAQAGASRNASATRENSSAAPGGTGGAVPPSGARTEAGAPRQGRAQGLSPAPLPPSLAPGGEKLAAPPPPPTAPETSGTEDAFDAAMRAREQAPDAASNAGGGGPDTGTGRSPELTGAAAPGAQSVPLGDSGPVEGLPDEDILARQLREAAQRETDPDLREKLWREYRRYSGQE